MGLQLVFDRQQAVAAGMLEVSGVATYEEYDEEGMPWREPYEWRAVEVQGCRAADYGDASEVCIDANLWGSIREVFVPWLEAKGIEYREV